MAAIITGSPALLVIDMQNGFVHPSGSFGKLGMDVSNHLNVVQNTKKLIAKFDEKGLPVIFTRLSWKSEYSNCGRLLDKMAVVKDIQGFIEGSWDAEVIDELKLIGDDKHIVIDKTRNSAFWKKGMEDRLREMKVEQVVVTGVG